MLPIKVSNYYNLNRQNSIESSILSYVEDSLTCLSYCFGELVGDGLEVDERSLIGDKLLHDVCKSMDTRNWVLPEDICKKSASFAKSIGECLPNL